MELNELFGIFLRNHEVDRPDGRPLYAYRLSARDVERLRDHINHALRRHARLTNVDSVAAGLICLYSAECFARTYDGGPWRWDVAFAGLEAGGKRFDPNPTTRAAIVERGLRLWGRTLLEFPGSGVRYLTTLVCEGGLPRPLLRQQEAHFTRFLRRGLELREAAQKTSTEDLLAAEAYLLPYQFRNPVLLRTCSDLVEQIATLRAKLGDTGEADPVARLDKLDPTWRLRMPLRFDDDDNARRLLEGLVRHKTPRGRTASPVTIRTILDLDPDRPPRVLRRLEAMREVDEASLTAFVGKDSLPTLSTLSVRIGGTEQVPVARIVHRSERNGSFYRLDPLRGALPETALSGSVDWLLEAAGQRVNRWQAPLTPLGELPWVFRPRADGVWTLAGEGSARIKSDEAWVGLPQKASIENEPTILEERAGGERRWVRMQGELRFDVEGARGTIRTDATDDEAPEYRLLGARDVPGTLGQAAFIGPPTVERALGHSRQRVKATEVEFRSAHGANLTWRKLDSEALGEGMLRYRERGEARLMQRAVMLPGDFDVSRRGTTIRIASTALNGVDALAPGLEVEKVDHGFVLTPTSDLSIEEDSVAVRLDFGLGRIAHFDFRNPARTKAFVDRYGRILPPGASVYWRELAGIRACVLDDDNRDIVHLELRSPDGARLARQIPRLGERELPLDSFEEVIRVFLAEGVDCDASVQARIDGKPPTLLQIQRFATKIVPVRHKEDRTIELHPSPSATPHDFPLEARPIDDWGATPILLPRRPEGGWRYAPEQQLPGTTLFTAPEPHRTRFRPIACYNGQDVEARDELRRISAADLPSSVRVRELGGLWRTVMRDPDRPETARLKEMVLSLDDLPASTFHAVVALAGVPEASVWMLFNAGPSGFETVWEGLQRLNFAWWALPVSAWRHGVSQFAEFTEGRAAAVLEAERARQVTLEGVADTFARIQQRWPGGEAIFDALATSGTPGLPTDPLANSELLMAATAQGRAALTHVLRQAAMELRQRQAESRWPDWPDRSGPPLSTSVIQVVGTTEAASMGHHVAVLSGPVFVAEQMISETPLSDDHLLAARLFRAFDPQWFDLAQSISMAFFWNDRNKR